MSPGHQRRHTRSHRRLGALAATGALLAAGLLSGCGVSDEELRPGVAAEVGGTEISTSTIDDAIDTACGFFVDTEQPGFPRALARQQFVSALVQRAAASEALDDAGLSIGDAYAQAAAGLDADNDQIPAAQRAPFILLSDAATYVDAASTVLGQAEFSAEGDVPADPALSTQRGQSAIAAWLAGNAVAINPVYRLTVDDQGQVVSDSGGISVAVSDLARTTLLDPQTATQEQVDASATNLPASQLCGVPAT